MRVTHTHTCAHTCTYTQERALLEEGVRRFPTFEKHYLMLGQLEEREGRTEAARSAYR